MTTTKQINLAQLQAEAVAVPNTTHTGGLNLNGAINVNTGIAPVGVDISCYDAGGAPLNSLCASAQAAYNIHVALPNQSYLDSLRKNVATDITQPFFGGI